jgi:hypothetical protein
MRRLVGPSVPPAPRTGLVHANAWTVLRPWSAAEERSLSLKLPDGHRTHHPPPKQQRVMKPIRKTFQTQRRLRRRRGGWGISHRRLGSNRDVGPSSSYRDVRSTVHALSVDKARARRRGEIPHPPRRRGPPTSPTRATHLADAGHPPRRRGPPTSPTRATHLADAGHPPRRRWPLTSTTLATHLDDAGRDASYALLTRAAGLTSTGCSPAAISSVVKSSTLMISITRRS